MTINVCRKHCKHTGHSFSYLYKGDTCSCGDVATGAPVGDQDCQTRCSGDENQACGDETRLSSVYDGNLLAFIIIKALF